MRRIRNAAVSIAVVTTLLAVSACTPAVQQEVGEGIGKTLGQLVTWWLWTWAHSQGSGL